MTTTDHDKLNVDFFQSFMKFLNIITNCARIIVVLHVTEYCVLAFARVRKNVNDCGITGLSKRI